MKRKPKSKRPLKGIVKKIRARQKLDAWLLKEMAIALRLESPLPANEWPR